MEQRDATGRAVAAFDKARTKSPAPMPKRADVSGIVEKEHPKYRIKAGRLGGTYVARAFPKPPSKAQGVIAEAEGDTEQAAISALIAAIDARDAHRKQERRWEERASVSVPDQGEFVEALYQTSLTRPQIAMLKAHSFTREAGMTMDQLARAAGYRSDDMALKVFRKAGEMIADYLGIEIDPDGDAGREGAAHILAVKVDPGEDGPAVWIMHSELREAVQIALK